MIGKKDKISRIIYHTGLNRLLRPFSSFCLTILNYHRILPQKHDFKSDFDDGVWGVTVSVFEKQMKWLRDNFHILSESDIIDFSKRDRLPRRPAIAITLDDGYRDNYTLAYPILSHYNIPAIFFIPTDSINNRSLGWWDIIAYVIKKSSKSFIRVGDQCFHLGYNRVDAIIYFQHKMALSPENETLSLLTNLATECNVALPARQIESNELMNWEEIREVANNGMTIGSHTVTHRVLSTISLEEQQKEFINSKKELERQLGCPVRSLAYPVGGCQHFTDETTVLAKQAGYELAFSFNTGVNRLRIANSYKIRRVSSPETIPLFTAACFCPEVFFWYDK